MKRTVALTCKCTPASLRGQPSALAGLINAAARNVTLLRSSPMDRLWTPWRYNYITGQAPEGSLSTQPRKAGVPEALSGWPGDRHCVFCNMIAAVDWAIEHGMEREEAERAAWILDRGEHTFLVLNAFPYSNGHLMAVPYAHHASLAELPLAAAEELMLDMRRAETALRDIYKPDGLNLGMNLGEAAGAGVASHLHVHALPRWSGDSNFMTVIGETRVLPEMLAQSWQRLRTAFKNATPTA
jgi:ATP adenylyltransferase